MSRPAHRQGIHRKARNEANSVGAYERYIEGATYAEIARELGIDRATARARVHRGTALLRGDVEDKRDRIANEHLNDMTALEQIATDLETETKDRIAAYNARRGHAERFSKLYGLDEAVKTDLTSDGEKITIIMNPDRLPVQETPEQ